MNQIAQIITDFKVIFNPVGDDLFNPLSTAPIHSFPSLLASDSWKHITYRLHGLEKMWRFNNMMNFSNGNSERKRNYLQMIL